MQKDSRYWILIGALVLVAGLFAAFLWSVMASPGAPNVVRPEVNVTDQPDANMAASSASGADKPVEPLDVRPDEIVTYNRADEYAPPPPPPPPDTERIIREARESAARARAAAEAAAARARAQAQRAQRRARAAADDKPPEDGKPDY